MLTRRTLRTGLAAFGALIALGPVLALGNLAQVASASPSASGSTDEAHELAAYRLALLTKQTVAIEVTNVTIRAVHARRVQELGYEPGTTDPREIARQMMLNKYGWAEDQYACYDAIIMRESRWIATADNPRSSAYGIPQALPGRRMAAFGADWRTNPATQIAWGLDYVNDRYGTPCRAWSFKRGHGWY